VAATCAALLASSCSSVDVVRLQPDLLEAPEGMEPLAGIQATCMGFYLFTLGIPYADMDKAVNDLLFKEAKKLGAERVVGLRFEGTPSGGIWFLTKLLGFRFATAYGIALVKEPGAGAKENGPGPPPLTLPPDADEKAKPPASAPGK
jgi:hypothetical protein